MAIEAVRAANVERDALREGIRDKYSDVAGRPELGFHFRTGASLAAMLNCPEEGRETDVFSCSKHESDAAEFDTHGVTFAACEE